MYLHQVRGFVNIKIINRKCHKIYLNERVADFPKTYDLNNVKKGWYEIWEKNKYFQPEDDNDKPIYKMILPPPNVTGTLHLGHALTTTVQDVLARWHKMRGYSVVWIPGFDHAGIATQTVVEKYLQKTKNIKRNNISKEDFLKAINQWTVEKRSIISDQLKALGASLDWSREYFTISENHNKIVTHAFIELHKKQLLYRNKRLINWSTALGSTISDIEVDFEALRGKTDLEVPGYSKRITFGQIFEISYNLVDSDKKLNVATTRPETLPGDVALAVNPDDSRYSQYIGKKVKHPLSDAHIPILSDPNVKMDFGIVKITPAHDHFDYAVANKHNLELITVIEKNGRLSARTDRYVGMPRFYARQQILKDLANMGSLVTVNDHAMYIPRCSRTGDIIELLLQEQWFINCKDMSLKALKAIEDGSLKLDPVFHNKTWINWLSNNKDWCVSRQLWWGHQIPAYHFKIDNESKWVLATSQKEALNIIKKQYDTATDIHQDNDVLDTWFSSSLLPLSAMGWLTNEREFNNFYPLSLMETGNDILFFWIARMAMLGLELTNKLPFNDVLLHGILCDTQGKKMSKSRGNVIHPENILHGISLENLNNQATKSFEEGILSQTELKRTIQMNKKIFPKGIPECGVDALRFTLCSHNIKERTVSFDIVECEQNKFFCNKIWQASRYIVLMTSDNVIEMPETFTMIDQWILSRLTLMVDTVNKELERKNFHKVVAAIKEFLYYEFCDYYIEGTKPGFQSEQLDIINSHRYTLTKCMEVSLRILAPITPYLSDDLYSRLSRKLSVFKQCDSLLESLYPSVKELQNLRNVDLEKQMSELLNTIISIRSLVSILTEIKNKRDIVEVHIALNNSEEKKLYEYNINIVRALLKLNHVEIFTTEDYVKSSNTFCSTTDKNCSIYVVINDGNVLHEANKLLENKKLSIQKKLNSLMKVKSRKNYETISEEDKVLHDKQIYQLQGELKRLLTSL
ncbi:valine--tRNA ligase, mitochondrial-like isoform X2 [Phymastichus coffea]|uniref:valine--tRNA ligase, mitochondrial-like isoform X2 n=1 Tax=Phymastichus coffea TaxID=108790 RepID=UPI00273A7FAF|nr:valine--tRNA ligase, mitochondrial-like isoform X2 [Phymastichus coffea]